MINLTLDDFYGKMFEHPKIWDCFVHMEKHLYFGLRNNHLWRKHLNRDWDSWESFASDIKKNGILKPITVYPVDTPEGTKYAIRTGYHRIVAGHMAGLTEFPCEVT